MTPPPHLSRLDAARIALLHSLSPSQQWELASCVAAGVCTLPLDEAGLRASGLRFRGRKRDHLALLPPEWEMEPLVASWSAHGWRFLTAHEQHFPRELWEIPDPPLHLFVEGSLVLTEDDRPRVAIVGSRAASAAGLRIARELGRDLALAGCVVVSGLARGIDGAAHRGALSAGGNTIAVLGTGLDRTYPDEHREMAREIGAQGLLVTEFAPGTPPFPLHFPRRNRILVGLADALVVVEGGERSGARSSVDHALDQGREVLAVPRDPLHEGSRLPNRLLRDGATPLVSARDVIDLLEGSPGWNRKRPNACTAPAPIQRGDRDSRPTGPVPAKGMSSVGPAPNQRGDRDSRPAGPDMERGMSSLGAEPAREGASPGLVGRTGPAGPDEPSSSGAFAGRGEPPSSDVAAAVPSLQQRVRTLVERTPGRSLESLAAEFRTTPPRELLGVLTTLELEGRLRRVPGGRWFPAPKSRARA